MSNILEQTVSCTLCANDTVEKVVDFGMQPPANRFIEAGTIEENQDMYHLGLGYCSKCKTVQLSNRMPMNAIQPRFSWLTYNEPELHLDDVASKLRNLPGIGPLSRMLGVTYKDQSTLDRLTKLGLPQSSCLSFQEFNIFRQQTLGAEVKEKYEPVQLLLARHVVEHSMDVMSLIAELKALIAPGGYLVIELPDSEKILRAGNHAFVWEEHISYFTEQSLPTLAEKVGANIVWSAKYPYNYEDSLMAALQFDSNTSPCTDVAPTPSFDVNGLLQQFNQTFAMTKLEWRDLLQGFREQGKKVAVFGAGHLAVKLINFMELTDLIDCVIDDNANKAGMYMPGSKLPILPSAVLKDRNIKICLSTLSPESEQKVRQKFASYFEEGGVFISAFKTLKAN